MTIGAAARRPTGGTAPAKRERSSLVSQILHTRPAVAPALLRVTLALVIFPHGAQHLAGWFGGYGFSGTYGWMTGTLGIPGVLAAVAIVTEFVAPLALLVGLGGRAAALGIAGLMAVAASTHAANGFFMNWTGSLPAGAEGFEYHLLVIAMALAVVIQGSGAWSVDRALTVTFESSGRGTRSVAWSRGGAAFVIAALLGLAACDAPTVPDVPPAVATVELGQLPVDLTVGGSHQLIATPKAADGRKLSGQPIQWTSGDTLVATVGPTGLLTARAAGSATITATSEGRSGTATVAVTNPLPVLSGSLRARHRRAAPGSR
jgi:putative oxidoreductase